MTVKHLLTPMYLDQWRKEYEETRLPNLTINRVSHAAGPDIQHRVIPTYQYITQFVADTIKAGGLPVTWNGDCCMSIPTLAGVQQAGIDPVLLWLDAHGDFNTWKTSPSGFLGGMPLAMIVGKGEQTIAKGVGLRPLPEERVYLTDARDLDPEEGALIASSRITHLHRLTKLLGEIKLPQRPIWVHFDIDVMRVEDCPATNYPTPGGPTIPEIKSLFTRIKNSGQLVAVSVSLWEPTHPEAQKSEETVKQLVELLVDNQLGATGKVHHLR
ncbi:MAG: arginase family protein [Chloroflexota bacterium]